MVFREIWKEAVTVILATIILAISISFYNTSIVVVAAISFLIIISANVITKKIVGYHLETNVRTKFWSWYQFGFRKDFHFKTPVPMAWLPLLLAPLTKGFFWWLGILEFDVEAKTERVSKRHGLYRFTQVTEWHIAWIAAWAIIINILLGIAGYFAGFELFAKLSIYFAAWSIVPLSNLDGNKILFGSKGLWATLFIVLVILLSWGLLIV
jgi:hypothetical protein